MPTKRISSAKAPRMRRHEPLSRAAGHATVRRARRDAVSIDLAKTELRALMVEQSHDDGGDYVTVYRGSRAELVAAGVPQAAFPPGDKGSMFRVRTVKACSTGGCETLQGAMNPVGEGFELEIGWGSVMPYVQCCHPAVGELARMILIDVSYWAGEFRLVRSEVVHDPFQTFDRLAEDSRAEYKPTQGSPGLRISTEFRERLKAAAHELYVCVHREAEVFADMGAAALYTERFGAEEPLPSLRLVVDNTREDAAGD